MNLFIKKGNKYFRNNSDGSLSEVLLGDDGYFRWTQKDGKKVRSAKKYKVIPKEKSFILKAKDWFVDASIGASVAENPAVMTAAGYEKENGKWQVNPTSKGATKLREDLPIIGITGLAMLTPGAIPSLLIGSGTEALERKVLGKSVGDVTSNFVKENNPISSNGYFGILGSYLWDKGSDLIRPEYALYPTIKWGTTSRLVGSGVEFDVHSAPFFRTVTKIGDVTPSEAALKNSVPGTIPLKYKGRTPEGLYKYTLKKVIIPKLLPKSMHKLYLYMTDHLWFPARGDSNMLDFMHLEKTPSGMLSTFVTDLGQGNIGFRNRIDLLLQRRPVIIDNGVLNSNDYFAMIEKKGGKLIPKADSGMKVKYISSNSEEAKLNKRRQLILRKAGNNVKVDGSWGNWLLNLWNKYISSHPDQTKKVNFNNITIKENRNRTIPVDAMELFQDSLIGRYYPYAQRLAILATSLLEVDERGAATKGVGGNGYLGLNANRMSSEYLDDSVEGRAKQIKYILDDLETIKGSPNNNWTSGDSQPPYVKSAQEGFNLFWNANTSRDATIYLNKNYIRPKGKTESRNNRAVINEILTNK